MKSGSLVSFLVLFLVIITAITMWSWSAQGHNADEKHSAISPLTRGANPPEIELLGPITNGSESLDPIPRYKDWPHLEWTNHDHDPEDLEPGATKYTLYIGTNRSQVENMSTDVQSPRFVNMSESETTITPDDTYPDIHNITYWGIRGIDSSGTQNYTSGGAFRYDYEAPDIPVNLTISPIRYFDAIRLISYIEIGKTFSITVNASSSIDDPGMNRVVFQARYDYALNRQWFDIGVDNDTTDNSYNITWRIDEVLSYWPPIVYFRAIAYDDLNNTPSVVHSTGKYYFIESITDLSLKNVTLSTNKTISGRNVTILVTIHNGGEVVDEAYEVSCSVWIRHWHGANEFLGAIDFGHISPWVDYHTDDPLLGKGDKRKELIWRTPRLKYGSRENYTIFVTIGTNFVSIYEHTVEVNATNNEGIANLTVIGTPAGPPEIQVREMTGEDAREGFATFSILCKSNVIVEYVEYWLKSGDQWNRAERDDSIEFDPEIWESAWIVHINTSGLKEGEHFVAIRADNGKYLSDSVFTSFLVVEQEDEERDFVLLEFIIMILVILFCLLILVVEAPDEFLPSVITDLPALSERKRSRGTGSHADMEIAKRNAVDEKTVPDHISCAECGSSFENKEDTLPIRLTCPDCGHENVRDELKS